MLEGHLKPLCINMYVMNYIPRLPLKFPSKQQFIYFTGAHSCNRFSIGVTLFELVTKCMPGNSGKMADRKLAQELRKYLYRKKINRRNFHPLYLKTEHVSETSCSVLSCLNAGGWKNIKT
jgi:hypothetical protein